MKHRILYLIIGVVLTLTASADTTFRTTELRRLATVLQLDTCSLVAGYSHPKSGSLPLTVHVKAGIVDHIGLYLFSDELRMLNTSPVFDFLERYFLQLKYPPQMKSAVHMMRDDEFQFLLGNMETVKTLKPADAFSYSYDNHRYIATWTRQGESLLSVSFPVEYELMSGENKIEAEDNLYNDILSTLDKGLSDSTLVTSYDTYIIPGFTNRLYIVGHQLVNSSDYPLETAANLMLSPLMPGKCVVSMTQLSYGFKKKVFDVPLKQWFAFCRQNNCQLYFGVENIAANGDVKAVVLAVNRSENYNHVLTVTIPAEVIASRQGTIDARLYPYVPMHNVLNMFASYHKSNPKTFVSQ